MPTTGLVSAGPVARTTAPPLPVVPSDKSAAAPHRQTAHAALPDRPAAHCRPYPIETAIPRQREMALRAGVNLVVYALTGNYKADQIHVPALLERLGR